MGSGVPLIGLRAGAATFANASGGALLAGAVVVRDPASDSSFKTTTSAGDVAFLGVLIDAITNGNNGRVLLDGTITMDVTGAVTRGQFLKTSTSAGSAIATSTYGLGVFGVALDASAGGQVKALVFRVERSPGAIPHALFADHNVSLKVTDAGGTTVDFEAGQLWVGTAFFSVSSGSIGVTNDDTTYVFVNSSGAVAVNTTGFPSDAVPLAEVVAASGSISDVNDRRSYLGTGITAGGAFHDGFSDFVAAEHVLEAAIDHDALLNFEAAEHVLEAAIDHDALLNFAAAEHLVEAAIDHDALLNFAAAEHVVEAAIDHDALLNFATGEHFTEASIDHGTIGGRADDDHLIYALLAGRAGAQVLIGGTASGEDLTLQSTAHATRGSIFLGSSAKFELDEATGQLLLPVQGVAAGLVIGGVPLFRSDSNFLTMPGGGLVLGEVNVLPGALYLHGSASPSAEGGQISIELAQDHIGTFTTWNLDVQADDLRWFQSSGQLAMLFKGHATTPSIEIENTLAVKGSLVSIGLNDSVSGNLYIYGAAAGNAGAAIRMYLTDAHDTDFDIWVIDVNSDDLRFYQSSGEQAMRLRGSSGDPNVLFPYTVYHDGNTFFKTQAAPPAAPAANYLRHFILDQVGRVAVPSWVDENSDLYMAIRESAVLVPQPINGSGGLVTGSEVSKTSAFIGLVTVETPITLDTITYNITIAGADADNTIRIAVYSEDGQTRLVDETDNLGTATGLRVVTLGADVLLPPGNYYTFMCYESGTGTGPTPTLMGTEAFFDTGGSGEPDLVGLLTVTAGAAPTTFDPTAITTPAANNVPYFRFDGA